MNDPFERSIAIQRALTIPTCPVCQQPRYQKHAETCPGPRQRIADPPTPEPGCDCVGAWHQRGCELAYWPDGDAA